MPETFETIRLEFDAGVAHVTLNRPDARNAMSMTMVDELMAALERAGEAGARAVVLRGAGGHFCSGGDLKDMGAAQAAEADHVDDPVARVNARFGHLCAAYAGTGLPVIAVLEGVVMGGGFGLACVADVALARETAVFRLPETSLGLVPAQIAPFLVERLGYSEAKRLAVTGGKIDAATAHRLGLVHACCDGEEAMEAALAQTLADIRRGAPGAIAATKALIRRARFEPAGDLVDDAASVFAQSARGAEGAEGLTAFLEKRPPAWAAEE
ncbi:enoyl-CoA hydratase [Marinicauda salina]|uniref:Enoyl-CoA hydratase n=1 Tax=Marinicauda salina TaxID=2135793 RepID=A0A2U2BVR6_9PROT|nr:enoyl-CoA hydratase-related protein [Marinicauda salina]PWE18116.1 enoyl-CoA hydratase [Marinicauda salina]